MSAASSDRPIASGSIPWVEVTPGVEVRMLTTFDDGAGYTAMFRFAPGTRLPTHHHLGRVHAYTVSGRWRYREYDWVAEAGSYYLEPAGSVHTLEVADTETEPAVVLFVTEAAMVILDEDGAPQMVWDTAAMTAIVAGQA